MKTTYIAGRAWHFSHSIGRPTAEHRQLEDGTTVGGFTFPIAITVGTDGLIFVLSRGYGFPYYIRPVDIFMRVGKLTIDQQHIGDFARAGFTWPAGIAVSKDGTVYCSDEYENCVAFYNPDNTYPFPQWNADRDRLGQWGEAGSEEGRLDGPNGLAFDSDDNLYVVDSRNDRVQKFTKDGGFLLGWGGSGTGEGQFNRPWGITIDHKGDVYVADWGNDRVQKFSPDGEFLMSFGSQQGEGGGLTHPADVAVDSDGDVYITDWGKRKVRIYEPDGDILATLHGDATELSKAGEHALTRDPQNYQNMIKTLNKIEDWHQIGGFRRPTGIVVDQEGRIIVTDHPGRLQVYIKEKGYEEPILNMELGQ